MLGGVGLWELVEQRADETPDARLLVDEWGDALTFGDLRREGERAAAGLAGLGVEGGTVVSWQLPTWCSSFVLVAALARLGAVQNPILPIYRSREVGFVVRQAGARLLVVPSRWRGFDYAAMATELAAGTDRLLVLLADRVLPEGDPAGLPPATASDGYGLTEAPLLTMGSVEDADDALAETEGCPMPGVELRIVDHDGREVGPGEEGEVRAKAPQVMVGYVDPALDRAAFDEDGWFRTGDLGRLEPGGLVVTGRLKDVIIRKGENISAKEVEDLLYGHPKVADVAVIGLPDPERGERCCAVVACRDPEDPLGFDEMVGHLSGAGLMRQKLPEQLELVDALPRNPSGKVVKAALRERY